MAKRLIAMLLSLVMVVSLAVSVPVVSAAVAADTSNTAFTAHLQFTDSDWAKIASTVPVYDDEGNRIDTVYKDKVGNVLNPVGNLHDGNPTLDLCTYASEVKGPGSYTVTWDMSQYGDAYDGVTAKGVSYLYVDIEGAYSYFKTMGYDIRNVKLEVDGQQVTVNPRYVWTYQSVVKGEEDDFVIELYNVDGVSGYYDSQAIDIDNFTCSESISVTFDVVQGNQYKAYLQFMDGDWAKVDPNKTTWEIDQTTGKVSYQYYDKDGVEVFPVGNYHQTYVTNKDTGADYVSGPGTYTAEWDMNAEEKFNHSTVKGITWLYVEIDDAFRDFYDAGYTVSDVKLYINGTEAPIDNPENLHTYPSYVEGEQDDYVIEFYNIYGYAGYWGQSAINTAIFDEGNDVRKIQVEFTIVDGEDKSAEDASVHTGKWVTPNGDGYDDFDLTLEGWVSGEVHDVAVPSDVVLVLDQSASMYTPVGLPVYWWCYELLDATTDKYPGLERYGSTPNDTTGDLASSSTETSDAAQADSTWTMLTDTTTTTTASSALINDIQTMVNDPTVDDTSLTYAEKFAQLGYLVAQSRTAGHAFCNITEHTHSAENCGICELEEHTHSAACGYTDTCSNISSTGARVTSFHNNYTSWSTAVTNTSGKQALHFQLEATGVANTYRVVDIAVNVPGATSAERVVTAEDFVDEGHCYMVVTDYNEYSAATSLNIGDCITVNLTQSSTAKYYYASYAAIAPLNAGMTAREIKSYDNDGNQILTYQTYTTRQGFDAANSDLSDGVILSTDEDFYSDKLLMLKETTSGVPPHIMFAYDFETAVQSDTYVIHGYYGTAGINPPALVTIRYLDGDGTTWITPEQTMKWTSLEDNRYTVVIKTDAPVFSKSVQFSIHGQGMYLAVDEVEVRLTNRTNVTSYGIYYGYLNEQDLGYAPTYEYDSIRWNGSLTNGLKKTTDIYNYTEYDAWDYRGTYDGNSGTAVTVHLYDEDDDGIDDYMVGDTFTVYAYGGGDAGISAPKTLSVTYSPDGTQYLPVSGEMTISNVGDGMYVLTIRTAQPISARNVNFTVQYNGYFVWIDEVEVGLSSTNDTFKISYLNAHNTTHSCDDDCYACGKTAHTHTATECGYHCDQPTSATHTHDGSCGLRCYLPAHEHSSSCGATTCGLEAHVHYRDCIGGTAYGCTTVAHTHSADCYRTQECRNNGCTSHSASCYVCKKLAHTHNVNDCGLWCEETEHIHGYHCDLTYDWFVVQYNPATKMLDMYRTIYTTGPAQDSNGVSNAFPQLQENKESVSVAALKANQYYFYKSQYGALFDAMTTFIKKLEQTGANHRVAVVGFASEVDNNTGYSTGTGIYVDGNYTSFNTSNYTQVSLYKELKVFITDGKEPGWIPDGATKCSRSECGECLANEYGHIESECICNCIICVMYRTSEEEIRELALKTYDDRNILLKTKGDALMKTTETDADGNETVTKNVYADALMQMKPGGATEEAAATANELAFDNIWKSIKAVNTNYYYTNHFLGMYLATQIFANDDDNIWVDTNNDGVGDADYRQRSVILFTDGLSQVQSIDGDAAFPYTYQEYTNDKTIEYARQLEREYKAKVYTIGTSTVYTENLSGTEFLYYASSEFSDVDSVEEGNTLGYDAKLADKTYLDGLKYYESVNSSETVMNAFQTVLEDIGGADSTLSITASMQDIIYEEFELCEELKTLINTYGGEKGAVSTSNTETINKEDGTTTTVAAELRRLIGVYTVNAENGTFAASATGLTFNASGTGVSPFMTALIEVGLRADGRYYIRVDGFNYAGNFVSTNGRDTNNDGVEDFWGQKLVVVVPIETRSSNIGGIRQDTNYDTDAVGGYSGIIAYDKDATGRIYGMHEAADFVDPHVDIPTTVTVKKTVDGKVGAGDTFTFNSSYSMFGGYGGYAAWTNEEVTSGKRLGGNYLQAVKTDQSHVGSIKPEGTTDPQGTLELSDVLIGEPLTVTENQTNRYDFIGLNVSYVENGQTVTVNYTEENSPADGSGISINWETGEVTVTEVKPQMTIEFVNKRALGDITIGKVGTDETLDPGQSFIFHVQGVSTDDNTKAINLTVVIKEDGQITIKDLPVGDYVITEDSGWSWRYSVTDETDKYGVTATDENEDAVEVTKVTNGGQVTLSGSLLTVTFDNTRDEEKWMDGNSYCQNLFVDDSITKKEDENESTT